ncbi:SDR family NAD(P)-dependent oxidoreductase [Rhizobium etli]|uniref:SDR family NAD(P)-dependent oxidoreductase n=1 Tax=Rhizobium etli TaxID=29449 RepID=UPI000383941C|nr:glucose 1-dehydrogenase [Rhizobium etli]AGS24450.1 short-chain dehydrogenase/reductase SDR family protein [Rhizobium etli bv. mimosae str. Mim1]
MDFENKGVVVTGAAGVFGRWIVEFFAREGANICLSDVREDHLKKIAADLRLDPTRTIIHATELTKEASIKELAAQVRERWGAPDIVVNNAGIYPRGLLLDLEVAEWDRIFDVNFRAPFIVSREMAKLMIAENRAGSIINISSGSARHMSAMWVPYNTSKTALERLSKGLALELAPYRIRVNVVEPGFAPGSEVSLLTDHYVEQMIERIPLKRASGPDDAAGAIGYLCSDKASFITGAVLSVDGGNSIGTAAVSEKK